MPYNPWLVLLSFVVAFLASLTALDLAGRVRATEGGVRDLWLGGGALAMGTGIWAMHFIGMLAMQMPTSISYDLLITLASMLAAVLSAVLALRVVCEPHPGKWRLLTAGTVMGGGICLMHYAGMEAMEGAAPLRYEPVLFLASVVIAILASTAALWLVFKRSRAAITTLSQVAGRRRHGNGHCRHALYGYGGCCVRYPDHGHGRDHTAA